MGGKTIVSTISLVGNVKRCTKLHHVTMRKTANLCGAGCRGGITTTLRTLGASSFICLRVRTDSRTNRRKSFGLGRFAVRGLSGHIMEPICRTIGS